MKRDIVLSGSVAEPEQRYEPLTVADVVKATAKGTLQTLSFMRHTKTGLPVVVLPLLIVAVRIALWVRGGEFAVDLAQTELWLIWLWCVFRIFA